MPAQKLLTRIRAYLLADATLSGLVGTRLTTEPASQKGTTPYVVMAQVGGSGLYAHDGATGNEEARLQFDIYAPTMLECTQVRDAIVARIGGFTGLLTDLRVGFCFLDNDLDFYSDGAALKRKVIDFRLMVS